MESESLGKRKQIYIFFLSTGSSHSITHTPYFFFFQRHIFYKISRTISYSSGSAISFRYGRDDIISSFSNLVTAHILQQIRGFSSLCRTFTAHITFLVLLYAFNMLFYFLFALFHFYKPVARNI